MVFPARLALDTHPWSTFAKLGPRWKTGLGLPVNYVFKSPVTRHISTTICFKQTITHSKHQQDTGRWK